MAEVMNLTKEDLERMKSVDIKTVDKDTLVDINLVKIDESLPREERVRDYIRQIGNPYCYLDHGVTVKIYQMIGYVYGERYHDYVNAVRFLNRSYRIGFDNIILESLGEAYYFLGIKEATREDGIVEHIKVDIQPAITRIQSTD